MIGRIGVCLRSLTGLRGRNQFRLKTLGQVVTCDNLSNNNRGRWQPAGGAPHARARCVLSAGRPFRAAQANSWPSSASADSSSQRRCS